MGFPARSGFYGIYNALGEAAKEVYAALKAEHGLKEVGHANQTGDEQLQLDVLANEAFLKHLRSCQNVKHVISEESPELVQINQGEFSIALDPLDGSKSAIVGIPSGAIFCVFSQVKDVSDFNGSNVRSSGFFVFGLNLEIFFADATGVFKGIYEPNSGDWQVVKLTQKFPSARFFAVNASNKHYWETWLQEYYEGLISVGADQKPHNLRWYASMVSEIKRLILQGGVFAYPGDTRKGYESGHLRLVYEAIPMAYLVHSLGGSSFDGVGSLLAKKPRELHEKTPVFLGEVNKIRQLENAKNFSLMK
jgi:fructose-1,6-bisphosphatase I